MSSGRQVEDMWAAYAGDVNASADSLALPDTPNTPGAVPRPGAYAPTIVGHRGASLVESENTMAAFERAEADGATFVECDVHLSRDGTPIIIHDESIDRTADPAGPLATGAVADLSDAQLASVDLLGGHPVPHLGELLAMRDLGLYVEVKVAEAAIAAASLMHAQRPDHGARDTVISFVPEALRVVKAAAPHVQRGLILDRARTGMWALMEELECGWFSCSIDGITEADVAEARRRGMRVNVWTVNAAEQLHKAVRLGVDSISTDDPAWAIRALPGAIALRETDGAHKGARQS